MTEVTTTETTANVAPSSGEAGNASTQNEGAASTAEQDGGSPEEVAREAKLRNTAQQRLAAERARRGDVERQLDATKLELEAIRRQLNAGKAPEGGEGQAAPEQRANESNADFERRVDVRAQEILHQRDHKARVEAFNAAGLSEYPDFHTRCDAVAAYIDRPHIPAFLQAIMDTENGHIAVAKLSGDPDNLERILKLSPTKMAVELDKLASEKPPKPKKPISSAPDPIKPASGNARADGYRPNMTVEEHVEWVRKNDPARQGVYAKR